MMTPNVRYCTRSSLDMPSNVDTPLPIESYDWQQCQDVDDLLLRSRADSSASNIRWLSSTMGAPMLPLLDEDENDSFGISKPLIKAPVPSYFPLRNVEYVHPVLTPNTTLHLFCFDNNENQSRKRNDYDHSIEIEQISPKRIPFLSIESDEEVSCSQLRMRLPMRRMSQEDSHESWLGVR